MRNSVYPTLYIGNNDDQMLNSVISPYTTRRNHNSSDLQEQNISVCEYNFFHESQLCNNQVLGNFSPLSAIEIPSPLNYYYLSLPGLHPISDASISNIIASSTSAMYRGDATIEQLYAQNLISASLDNDRKRSILKSDIGCATVEEESIKRMKNVVPPIDKRMSERTRGEQTKSEEKAKRFKGTQAENPPKKSQRIGDKIITLQKLVSPFGKTDTASVLKDTADHIKMLYNQIEMLTNPYFQPDAFLHYYHKNDPQVGTPEMSNGLAERGLCVVPVSFTQNINKEEKR